MRVLSKEHREKIRQTMCGKHLSRRTKEKISQSMKGKNVGSKNGRWNGGKTIQSSYVFTLCKNHPSANKNGYILEHRLVMEKHLGRYLKKTEIVHHIDKNTENNTLKNLMLFPNELAHKKYHKFLRKCQRAKV